MSNTNELYDERSTKNLPSIIQIAKHSYNLQLLELLWWTELIKTIRWGAIDCASWYFEHSTLNLFVRYIPLFYWLVSHVCNAQLITSLITFLTWMKKIVFQEIQKNPKYSFAERSNPPFIKKNIIGYPPIFFNRPNFTASQLFSNCIQIYYFNFYKMLLWPMMKAYKEWWF